MSSDSNNISDANEKLLRSQQDVPSTIHINYVEDILLQNYNTQHETEKVELFDAHSDISNASIDCNKSTKLYSITIQETESEEEYGSDEDDCSCITISSTECLSSAKETNPNSAAFKKSWTADVKPARLFVTRSQILYSNETATDIMKIKANRSYAGTTTTREVFDSNDIKLQCSLVTFAQNDNEKRSDNHVSDMSNPIFVKTEDNDINAPKNLSFEDFTGQNDSASTSTPIKSSNNALLNIMVPKTELSENAAKVKELRTKVFILHCISDRAIE